MKKIRKNLITIGIVSIMALSFTACEKDSDDSKLSSYSSKAGSSSGSSNDVDLISKAMQDGDAFFSFDGFTLLDGDVPPTNDDKSSGAGGSDSKVNSGANSGIWVVVIIQRLPQVAMVETQVQVQVAHHLHLIQENYKT